MRTTLVLDDRLFRVAKKRAAERNTTMSEVVNDALRQLILQPRGEARRSVQLPTFGDPGRARRVSPREIANALLADD